MTNVEMFGSYIVVMTIIYIGEGLMDFGFTDTAVKNISQDQSKRTSIITSLAVIKIVQVIIAYAVIVVAIYLLDFKELIQAVLIGGIALIFYGTALIFRVNYRLDMTMYKDMWAEATGVLLMIVLIFLLCLKGTNVAELIACHTVSRLIYLLVTLYINSKQHKLEIKSLDRTNSITLIKQASPLGFAGLMVSINESLVPLIISKLMDMEAVAIFSVAIRFIIPVTVIIQSITNVFFTPLSNYWFNAKDLFSETQQNVVEISTIIASILFCLVFSGAEFLIGLFGDTVNDSVNILRALSWLILAKAITVSMFTPIIICGGQRLVMWSTLLMLIISTALFIFMVPRYGVIGVVGVLLIMEIPLAAIPMFFVSQYMAKYKLQSSSIMKHFISSSIAVMIVANLSFDGTLMGAILSVILFITVSYITGGISKQKIKLFTNNFKNRSMERSSK